MHVPRGFGPALLVLLAAARVAAAGPPAADLTITWEEGEYGKDIAVSRVDITVTGSKIHYVSKPVGRDAGKTKPLTIDGTVKDPQKLAAALAALDAVPVTPTGASDPRTYRATGCVIRGKAKRCASLYSPQQPGDREDELKAIYRVEAAVLEGVKL